MDLSAKYGCSCNLGRLGNYLLDMDQAFPTRAVASPPYVDAMRKSEGPDDFQEKP
jgi:hypothetical protein